MALVSLSAPQNKIEPHPVTPSQSPAPLSKPSPKPNPKPKKGRCWLRPDQKHCRHHRSSLNFQGFPGTIHSPTARGLVDGEMWLQYSSYSEHPGKRRAGGTNLALGFGFLPWLSIAGRISAPVHEFNKTGSDLSLNIHARLPWIPPHWFELAAGVQDLGGQTGHYRAQYIALSRAFASFYATVAWGRSVSPVGRGQGWMASLQWQPFSWTRADLEWDGGRLNAGLSLRTPPPWFWGWLALGTQWMVDGLDRSDRAVFGSAYLHIPLHSSPAGRRLDSTPRRSGPISLQEQLQHGKSWGPHFGFNRSTPPPSTPPPDPALSPQRLAAIERSLQELGFDRVLLESKPGVLELCVDNNVFVRSHIDAIGVALGIASQNSPANTRIDLHITRFSHPIVGLQTRAGPWAAMLAGESPTSPKITAKFGDAGNCQILATKQKPSATDLPFGRPILQISPALRTAVATELGILNAQVGLEWGGILPLWWGGLIRAKARNELFHTKKMAPISPLHFIRQHDGLEELALHQALWLPRSWMGMISVGRLFMDHYSGALHLQWQRGPHRISAFGSLSTFDFSEYIPSYLGRYRLELPLQGSSTLSGIEVTGGTFLHGGLGMRVAAFFQWGDTQLELTYRHGQTKVVGFAAVIPLDLRRQRWIGNSNFRFQIRGNPRFRHEIRTRIGERANTLVYRSYLNPTPGFSALDEIYTDGARLSESYLRRSWKRMREAYFRYAKPPQTASPPPPKP